jgi:hypothetical protein
VEEQEGVAQTFGTVAPVVSADPLQPVDPNAEPVDPDVLVLPPYEAPKVKQYVVSLEVLGGYPNIKELLKKLTTLDRLQETQGFKISVGENTSPDAPEGEAAPVSNGSTLTLTYDTFLPYQLEPPIMTGEEIVNIPGLDQPTFNFTTVSSIQSGVTSVPDVVLGTDGKSNPFE